MIDAQARLDAFFEEAGQVPPLRAIAQLITGAGGLGALLPLLPSLLSAPAEQKLELVHELAEAYRRSQSRFPEEEV